MQILGGRKDPGDKEVCPLNRRPTDEEAEMAGFLNARSWYLYSSRERGLDLKVGEINFDSLPSAEPDEAPFDGGHADVWAHKRGEIKGGGERMSSILFRAKEHAIAQNGDGLVDDPARPKPAKLPDNTERTIQTLQREIHERKLFLKSQGLTGKQIKDERVMRKFINELIAIEDFLPAQPAESADDGVALFNSAALSADED